MANDTILILEDNEIQREGLAIILRNAGYSVLTAKNNHEALSVVQSGPKPNLILVDMLACDAGDGWDFLQQRQHDPELLKVPVIITTGIDNATEAWAASLGACGLLHKPLEVKDVLNLVSKCL
jgi:putative two-component system response regulator